MVVRKLVIVGILAGSASLQHGALDRGNPSDGCLGVERRSDPAPFAYGSSSTREYVPLPAYDFTIQA